MPGEALGTGAEKGVRGGSKKTGNIFLGVHIYTGVSSSFLRLKRAAPGPAFSFLIYGKGRVVVTFLDAHAA